MSRSKYLRIIAVFELFAFLGGTIFYIINMVTTFVTMDGWTRFYVIMGLIFLLFFGPALYVLFSSVADLLDSKEPSTTSHKTPSYSNTSHTSYSTTTSHLKYPTTTSNTISKKPIPPSKFKKGQRITTKKDLEDRDGNQVPKGSSGIVIDIEQNGLIKVDFKTLSSGIEVIMRVEESNLEECSK